MKELGELGFYLGTETKRMSKGMAMISPAVHALVFNNSEDKLFKVETLDPPTDDSGGG